MKKSLSLLILCSFLLIQCGSNESATNKVNENNSNHINENPSKSLDNNSPKFDNVSKKVNESSKIEIEPLNDLPPYTESVKSEYNEWIPKEDFDKIDNKATGIAEIDIEPISNTGKRLEIKLKIGENGNAKEVLEKMTSLAEKFVKNKSKFKLKKKYQKGPFVLRYIMNIGEEAPIKGYINIPKVATTGKEKEILVPIDLPQERSISGLESIQLQLFYNLSLEELISYRTQCTALDKNGTFHFSKLE